MIGPATILGMDFDSIELDVGFPHHALPGHRATPRATSIALRGEIRCARIRTGTAFRSVVHTQIYGGVAMRSDRFHNGAHAITVGGR